jgi:hypothetical protein
VIETQIRKIVFSVALSQEGSISATKHDEIFSLFNRALHIHLKKIDVDGSDDFYGHLVSAVLTYNVGLTLHLSGLESGDSQLVSRGLLYFYSMAHGSSE